ncbi:MAG: hypothetical protein J7K54_03640 [Candidatus Aenigmarchaeota archaeon]|nr:hypothetical protein [Candidatus Aenigmarchaeota archaeon]
MRKGFLHVAEAIIVSLLVFGVLAQFYSIPKSSHQWSKTKLSLMSQDLLYTLDGMGTDWFSNAQVRSRIESAIPKTMGYALSTKQLVRPVTNVLCVGSAADCAYLKTSVLINFTGLNGVDRGFNIRTVSPSSMDFSAGYLTDDVMVFMGAPPVDTPADEDALNEYLKEGNGVVEFTNLTQSYLAANAWQQDIFNVKWQGLPGGSGPDTVFTEFAPYERQHDILKIFNITQSTDAVFSDFIAEAVYPADDNTGKIVIRNEQDYSDGKPFPLVIVDWSVAGKGRTVWMANTTLTGSQLKRDLFRSLVVWAAGEKDYTIIPGSFTESSTASMTKIYASDIYEPVRISLTLGYHF